MLDRHFHVEDRESKVERGFLVHGLFCVWIGRLAWPPSERLLAGEGPVGGKGSGPVAVGGRWGWLLRTGLVAALGIGAAMVAGASPAQAAPGLRVAITDGRAFASPGDPIRYTITVVNPGDESATQLTARQVLADGLIFVSASDGGRWDAAGRVVRWPRFSLGPRLTQELTVEARVRPNAPLAESSTVTVSVTRGWGCGRRLSTRPGSRRASRS